MKRQERARARSATANATMPPIGSSVQSAKSASIPLFAFDTAFETNADAITSTVKTSNREVGKVAAENLIALLNGKGKYAVIAHSQTDATSTERRDGFLDYMKKNAPDMEMVGEVQYSNADQAKAQDIASAILQANPDLDAISRRMKPPLWEPPLLSNLP